MARNPFAPLANIADLRHELGEPCSEMNGVLKVFERHSGRYGNSEANNLSSWARSFDNLSISFRAQ